MRQFEPSFTDFIQKYLCYFSELQIKISMALELLNIPEKETYFWINNMTLLEKY